MGRRSRRGAHRRQRGDAAALVALHPERADPAADRRPVGQRHGAEAGLLSLTKGAATHARRALLDSGDLAATGDGLAVTDPLMADWLRERFPV